MPARCWSAIRSNAFWESAARQILGAELHEIFCRNTRLGRMVRESFDARMALVQEEITTETGRHVEISLDFIHDDRAALSSGDAWARC